jgi:hypothetical protein
MFAAKDKAIGGAGAMTEITINPAEITISRIASFERGIN